MEKAKILTDLQLEVTKKAVANFKEAITQHDRAEPPADVHPRIWQASRDAMTSVMEELSEAIAEYESEKSK